MKNAILQRIKNQYQLNLNSDHGISHWQRVKEIGLYLSKETKADATVINLFAYLHDSKRINEDYDLQHGARAALFASELYKEKLLDITVGQLSNLVIACKSHSQSEIKPENITIATCWDADRLDLWRLGATPNPELLFSEYAKRKKSFEYSYRLNNSQTKSGTSP